MAKPWEKYASQNAPSSAPWSKYVVSESEKQKTNEAREFDRPLEAAGKAAANVGLLGYLPELEALSSKAGQKLADIYYGVDEEQAEKFGLQAPSYEQELKKAREEQELLQKYNPKATIAGTVGGALVQAPILSAGLAKAGVGAGGGLLARASKASAIGAGLGAVQNPGELAEDDDQVNARLRGALGGAVTGLGGEVLGSAVGKGIEKISQLPQQLKTAASGKAIKASGGMLKDYRRLMGKNRVEEVGEFALKKGFVSPGDTFEDVALKTKQALGETGEKIGEIYSQTKPVIQNKESLVTELTKAINKETPKIGRDAYLGKMKATIEEIVNDADVLTGNPQKINEVIRSLDDRINWQKSAKDLPENQAGFLALRRALRNKVNDIVESTGQTELKNLNKDFQNLSELNKISSDRVARESANAMFGLRDTGIGIGTGVLAGMANQDVTPEGLAKAGLLGLGAAAASKGARLYGNPALARGMLKTSGALENVNANVRGLLGDELSQALPKGLIDPRVQFLQSMKVNKEKNE